VIAIRFASWVGVLRQVPLTLPPTKVIFVPHEFSFTFSMHDFFQTCPLVAP
jgi:hypothetical protein